MTKWQLRAVYRGIIDEFDSLDEAKYRCERIHGLHVSYYHVQHWLNEINNDGGIHRACMWSVNDESIYLEVDFSS